MKTQKIQWAHTSGGKTIVTDNKEDRPFDNYVITGGHVVKPEQRDTAQPSKIELASLERCLLRYKAHAERLAEALKACKVELDESRDFRSAAMCASIVQKALNEWKSIQ